MLDLVEPFAREQKEVFVMTDIDLSENHFIAVNVVVSNYPFLSWGTIGNKICK